MSTPTSTTTSNPSTGVHPSAVGSASQPQTASAPSQSTNSAQKGLGDLDAEGYPPQLHSGKVGLGPNYSMNPGLGEKISGYEQELKGILTHNPKMVQEGRERVTGELKRKELEDDGGDPFANPDEKKKTSSAKVEKEQAATVAPEGTKAAETQRKGEAV